MKFLKLDTLAPREKLLLAAAGFVVMMLLFQWLLVYPFIRRVADLNGQIREMKTNVRAGREELRGRELVEAQYDKVKDKLGRSLSDAEAINDVKGQVEDLAQKAGLKSGAAVHRDPVKKEFAGMEYWREYIVELPKVECDMSSLLKFMDSVMNADSMLKVLKVNFSKDKDSAVLKGSVLVARMMLPPEETAEASKEALKK